MKYKITIKHAGSIILLFVSLLFIACLANSENHTNIDLSHQAIADTTEKPSIPYRKFAEFKNDTLGYLRYNFKERKSEYINRPAKFLIADLEIPILSCTPTGGDPPHLDKIYGFFVKFEKSGIWWQKLNAKKIPNCLTFKFDKPINSAHSIYLSRKYQGAWTQQISDYYGSTVITDIGMVDRGLKE